MPVHTGTAMHYPVHPLTTDEHISIGHQSRKPVNTDLLRWWRLLHIVVRVACWLTEQAIVP